MSAKSIIGYNNTSIPSGLPLHRFNFPIKRGKGVTNFLNKGLKRLLVYQCRGGGADFWNALDGMAWAFLVNRFAKN
ncbi:MAG TPA: hypothetical protein DDX54_05870 [Rhodospirillaceae bacterium]|nr:hypothetical protein [Rhodospirillaceae bacterium]